MSNLLNLFLTCYPLFIACVLLSNRLIKIYVCCGRWIQKFQDGNMNIFSGDILSQVNRGHWLPLNSLVKKSCLLTWQKTMFQVLFVYDTIFPLASHQYDIFLCFLAGLFFKLMNHPLYSWTKTSLLAKWNMFSLCSACQLQKELVSCGKIIITFLPAHMILSGIKFGRPVVQTEFFLFLKSFMF